MVRITLASITLFAAAISSAAGQTRTTTASTYYPPSLYQMPDVTKSLNLTDQQVNRLNELSTKVQGTYGDRYGQLEKLNDNERAARVAELNRQYSNDWMTGAKDVFNQNQLNRYRQLQLQYGAFNSFNDPDVQKQLKFTDDQRTKLNDSLQWNRQQWQTINQQGTTDREKAQRLYADYWKGYNDRVSQFLTPEQLTSWRQMTGDPYQFQPTFLTPRQ